MAEVAYLTFTFRSWASGQMRSINSVDVPIKSAWSRFVSGAFDVKSIQKSGFCKERGKDKFFLNQHRRIDAVEAVEINVTCDCMCRTFMKPVAVKNRRKKSP